MTSTETTHSGSGALLKGIQVLKLVDDMPKKWNDTGFEISSAPTAAAQRRAGKGRGMAAVFKEDWKAQYQLLSKEQHDDSHQSGPGISDQRASVERPSSRNLEARENSKITPTRMTLNKEHNTDSSRNISSRNLADKLPKRNFEVKKREQLLDEREKSLLLRQRDIDAQLSLIGTTGRTSGGQINDGWTDLKREIRNRDGKNSKGKTKERERKLSLDTMEKLDIKESNFEQINSTNSLTANSRKDRTESSDQSIIRAAKSGNERTRSGSVTATKIESKNRDGLKDAVQISKKQSRKEALSVERQAKKKTIRLSRDTDQTNGIEVNEAKNDADQFIYLNEERMKSTTNESDDFEKTKRNAGPKESTGKGIRRTVKVTNDGSSGIKSENARIGNGSKTKTVAIDNKAKTETNSHDLLKWQRKIKLDREDAEGGVNGDRLQQDTKIKQAGSSRMKASGQIMMRNGNDGDDAPVNPKNNDKKLRLIEKSEMLINKKSFDGEKKHTKKVKIQKEDMVYAVENAENVLVEKGKQTNKPSMCEAEGNDTCNVRREIMRNAIEAKACRGELVSSKSSEQRMKLKGLMKDEKSNPEEHHSDPVRKKRRTKDAKDSVNIVTVTEKCGRNETVSEEKHSAEKNKDKNFEMEHSSVDLTIVDMTEGKRIGKDLKKTKPVRKAHGLANQTKVKHTSEDALVGSEVEVRMMKESDALRNMNGDDSINQKMERVNAAKNNLNLEGKITSSGMLTSSETEPELEEVLTSEKKTVKLSNSMTKQKIANTVKAEDSKKVPAKELMMKKPDGDANMTLAIGKCFPKAEHTNGTPLGTIGFCEQPDTVTAEKVSRVFEKKGSEFTEWSNSSNVDLLVKRLRRAREVEKMPFLESVKISAASNITEETGLTRRGFAANPLDCHSLQSFTSGSQNFKEENCEPSKMGTTAASKEAKNLLQNFSLCERKSSETKRSKERFILTEHDNESTSSEEIVEDIQIMECDDSQWVNEAEHKMPRSVYNMNSPATVHHGPCTLTKREGLIARKELQKVARKLDFGSELLLPTKTLLYNNPESVIAKTPGKRQATPIAFEISLVSKCLVEAKLKQSRTRVTRRVQRRFKDLRQIIEFDVWSMEIFHLPPLTEYSLYMRIYGMSNARQAYTQTGEDNISTEMQTDDVHLRSKSCQHPDHPGIEQYERDLSEVTCWNSEQLSKFLLNAGKVINSLLEEAALQHLDFTLHSSPETAAFSDGCIELGAVSFLKDRHVISGQFSTSESQFLLLVYSQLTKISGDEKLSQKGIICLWNLSTPDKPLKVLVSEAEPQCCCLSPSKPTVAFAGMNDGTLSVWDLRESSSLHKSYRDNTEEWVLRRPTFNTVALLNKDNHSSPVVSVAPVVGPSGHRDSRHEPGIPVDGKEECLAFQLASLEVDAVIVLWAVTEMKLPKEVSSEADFCLSAGGRIRLTKTRMITLEIPAIKTKCSSRCQKVFGKPFHALGLQLLPYNNSHYYVATDMGCIIHGLRYGERTNPSVHFCKMDLFTEVSGMDFCPFDQSCFLAGHRDGSVCLYTTQQVHPVAVWRNTTKNNSSIWAIHFSRSQPGTFFVLDDNSYLYTWNLLESTDSPVNQEHLSHSRVTHVCLSTHTKLAGSGMECRQQHMGIFTESGTCNIRKFSDRLSNFSSSDVDSFKRKLRSIS